MILVVDALKYYEINNYDDKKIKINLALQSQSIKTYITLTVFLLTLFLYYFISIVLTFLLIFFSFVLFLSTFTKYKKTQYNMYFKMHKINARILLFRTILFISVLIIGYLLFGPFGVIISVIVQIYFNSLFLYAILYLLKPFTNRNINKIEEKIKNFKNNLIPINDKKTYSILYKKVTKTPDFNVQMMPPDIKNYELWLLELDRLYLKDSLIIVDVSVFDIPFSNLINAKIYEIKHLEDHLQFGVNIKKDKEIIYSIDYKMNVIKNDQTNHKIPFEHKKSALNAVDKRAYGYAVGSWIIINNGDFKELNCSSIQKNAI